MKILAPADNVDTSLEVHRLYMIVIVGVEIVLKIYLSEAYILPHQTTDTLSHRLINSIAISYFSYTRNENKIEKQ